MSVLGGNVWSLTTAAHWSNTQGELGFRFTTGEGLVREFSGLRDRGYTAG